MNDAINIQMTLGPRVPYVPSEGASQRHLGAYGFRNSLKSKQSHLNMCVFRTPQAEPFCTCGTGVIAMLRSQVWEGRAGNDGGPRYWVGESLLSDSGAGSGHSGCPFSGLQFCCLTWACWRQGSHDPPGRLSCQRPQGSGGIITVTLGPLLHLTLFCGGKTAVPPSASLPWKRQDSWWPCPLLLHFSWRN